MQRHWGRSRPGVCKEQQGRPVQLDSGGQRGEAEKAGEFMGSKLHWDL